MNKSLNFEFGLVLARYMDKCIYFTCALFSDYYSAKYVWKLLLIFYKKKYHKCDHKLCEEDICKLVYCVF